MNAVAENTALQLWKLENARGELGAEALAESPSHLVEVCERAELAVVQASLLDVAGDTAGEGSVVPNSWVRGGALFAARRDNFEQCAIGADADSTATDTVSRRVLYAVEEWASQRHTTDCCVAGADSVSRLILGGGQQLKTTSDPDERNTVRAWEG